MLYQLQKLQLISYKGGKKQKHAWENIQIDKIQRCINAGRILKTDGKIIREIKTKSTKIHKDSMLDKITRCRS